MNKKSNMSEIVPIIYGCTMQSDHTLTLTEQQQRCMALVVDHYYY